MPIRKTGNKYYWGSKGPFDSRKKAEEVAQAAHASGYEGAILKLMKQGSEGIEGTDAHHNAIARDIINAHASGGLSNLEASNRLGELRTQIRLRDWNEAQRQGTPFGISSHYQNIDSLHEKFLQDHIAESGANEGNLNKAHALHEGAKAPTGWHGSGTKISSSPPGIEHDVNVEKILPAVGAALGAVGRVAAGAAGRGALGAVGRGALGAAGTVLPGVSALTGGGGEEDAGVDPGQAHAEEEWNRAVHNALLKLMKGIPIQKISLPDESTRGGREAIERIERIAQKVRPDHYGASGRSKSPLDVARPYLNLVRNGVKAGHIDHVVGHNALAEVHNIMNYGEDYEDHPDAIRYDTRKRNKNPEWAYLGKFNESLANEEPGNLSLNAFHKDYVNAAIHSSVSNKGLGIMDDLHRRIRMESPQWNPDDVSFTHAQVPAAMTDTQSGGFSESVAMPEDESIKPGQNLGYVDRPWWPKTHHRDPENMPWGKTEGYPPRSEQNLGYPSFESRRQEYDEDESPAMGGGTIQPKPQQPKPQPNAFERLYRQHFEEALLKEGDGGGDGGFNGLSGTVFTSSHAGIFTPSFGERGTRRRHRKNKHHQNRKRQTLLGRDKKNGVDRLVQFLQEGSPNLHKGRPHKDMTGQFQGNTASSQNITPRKQIDWQKKRVNKELEKTTEEINWEERQKGISKVEDHPTMGMNNAGRGHMEEQGRGATYPGKAEGSWTGTKEIPTGPDWHRKTTVQKATIPPVFGRDIDAREMIDRRHEEQITEEGERVFVPPGITPEGGTTSTTPFPDPLETHKLEQQPNLENTIEKASSGDTIGIGPLTRQNSPSGDQEKFVEKRPSKELRQQVVDQNDFENRVKGYDNNEDEKGKIDQPRAAGATASMANYPDSNMQMMEKANWGSGIDINQDDLHRGGELDEEEPAIEDKENEENDLKHWIPEDEDKVTSEKEWLDKFQLVHKNFIDKEDATPILSALLALDNG